MKLKDAMRGYDYEMLLVDALNDPTISTSRRLLAGAVIGEGLDTAYFATSELFEAFVELESDVRRRERHGQGFLSLEEILQAKNPLQMRLWYLLHEAAIPQAMMDLAWLKSLAYQRAKSSALLREERLPFHYTPARDMVEGPTASDWMLQVTERG